jgi:hypothetical protein
LAARVDITQSKERGSLPDLVSLPDEEFIDYAAFKVLDDSRSALGCHGSCRDNRS